MPKEGTTEKNIWPLLIRSSAWALILFVVSSLIFGTYYEDYQAFFSSFYSGSFSPGTPFYAWYFMADIGFSYLYASLYQIFPGLEWVSCIMFFYMYIAAVILFCLIDYYLKNKLSRPGIFLLQLIFFFLLFPDQIVNFNFTRVAYILCGTSLLAIIVLFDGIGKIRKHIYLYAALCTVYLVGSLTRSESSLAIALMFAGFVLAWHGNIRKAIQIMAIPLLIAVSIVGGIIIDINTSDKYYKQLEPDVEYQFTARRNMVPISEMKTAQDSVKYEAASQLIWGDPQNMPVSFLRSLIKPSSSVFADEVQWARTWSVFKYNCGKFEYLLGFNILLLVLLCIVLLRYNNKKTLLFLLLYVAAFVLLIIGQIYYTKIKERSFSPYLLFLMLTQLFLWVKETKPGVVKWWFMFVPVIVLCYMHAQYLRDSINRHIESLRDNKNIYSQVVQLAGGETLLLNSQSFGVVTLQHVPFEKLDYPGFNKIYVNEAQLTSLISDYRKYLEKECACDVSDFSNFYRYVLSTDYPDKVYLLSDQKRMELTFKYLRVIYGIDIKYDVVTTFPEVYQMDLEYKLVLNLYRLYPLDGQ